MNYLLKIKEAIIKNPYTAKFVCLLVAVVLWAYVGSTKIGEIRFRIPVELKNLPEHLVVIDQQELFVTVTINGKKEDINNINVKYIKAHINLERAVPGIRKKFNIEIMKSEVPDSVHLDLSQRKFYLNIDRKVQRKVEIKPVFAGELKEGYAMGIFRLDPETVIVTGPESIVSGMNAVETDKILISGLNKRTVKEVALDIKDNKNIVVDRKKVTVLLPVIEVKGLQKISIGLKAIKGNENYNYDLLENRVTLYVKSAKNENEVGADDVDAYVDLSQFDPAALFVGVTSDTVVKLINVTTTVKNRKDDYTISLVIPEAVSVKITRKPR